MFQDIKNDEFREFCRESSDIEGMLRLVREGADPNLRDSSGDSCIGEAVADYVVDGNRAENDDSPTDTQATVARAMEYVREAAALGWDVGRFGSEVMAIVAFSLDGFVFEFLRFMLQAGAVVSDGEDGLLDVLSTEESYQRCVQNDHCVENLLYAAYEMVQAAAEGRAYDGIYPFPGAEGMRIDRIVCLNDPHFALQADGATEFDGDIGFISGDRMLVVRDCLNLPFMNDRIGETPQRDGNDLFGPGVTGGKVREVSFSHRNVRRKDGANCGQPTLTLTPDDGKKLRFTHNFGENGDAPVQARFWVE